MTSEKRNPNATIAFVIYYPFHFYVYKNVYERLKNDAEFIIDLTLFFPTKQADDVLPAIMQLLDAHGASYRVIGYDDRYDRARLTQVLAPYEVLVSVWLRGCINLPIASTKKRVHMTYGVGKELTTFHLNKMAFDLILAYGAYDHAFYSLITHSVIIGNPKFDEWFIGTVPSVPESVIKFCDQGKKTLLYLPTHSDLCSIAELAEALCRLVQEYNVIVKLHYYTSREQPELVDLLQKQETMLILEDNVDLLPLLKKADVVVSDNSSAIFDAMLADKPLIVTDFHDASYLDVTHRASRKERRGDVGALTYSGSIEQRIKRDGTVDTIQSSDQLADAIHTILANDSKREKRTALAKHLFSFRDGQAGKRGALAIRELMQHGAPERPFLYHALRHSRDGFMQRGLAYAVIDWSDIRLLWRLSLFSVFRTVRATFHYVKCIGRRVITRK